VADPVDAMNARAAETVQPIVVALVPVVSDRRGAGLLLVAPDDSRSAVALPCTHVEITDVTWQEALVRALRDKGLDVTFDTHVRTASGPGGQMLIFGQTHPVHEHELAAAAQPLRIMRAEEAGDAIICEMCKEVVALWFAGRGDGAAGDRRGGGLGRRALDAELLARTDLAAAVAAVHELRSHIDDFDGDPYARTLLDQTLRFLIADQRARWGARAEDLLLTFSWHLPRHQMPVDELFDLATQWARANAISGEPSCFAEPALQSARGWMDNVALAHALGRVMAPVHVADPVGLVRSILGFGPFGRLSSRLDGEAEAVLTQFDEAQWELAYAALGAVQPPVLTPASLDPDALAERFADVLARQHQLATR
jgi:hypothetical protein